MINLRKYLKLFLINAQLELSELMNYRYIFIFNIFVTFLSHVIWPIISVFIYTTTSGLPGWTLEEFIIFQGTSMLTFGVAGALIFTMVFDISRVIADGTFDQYLLKPIKVIPYLMTSNFSPWWINDIFASSVIVIYGVITSGIKITLFNLLLYLYLIFIGVIMYFGFVCLIIALNFKFYKIHNIIEIFWQLKGVTSYPINIYGRWMAFAFTFILPLSIANFYPAQALLGRLTNISTIFLLSIGVLLFVGISTLILKRGIKYYSSAGG